MKNQGFILAKEGVPWLLAGLCLTALSILLQWTGIAWFTGLLTVFIAFFFRNPKRHSPQQQGLIIAPADGKICQISETYEKRFLKESRTRVSIFMSVLNCHINRSPVTGTIIDNYYHPGKFHLALVDKASDSNEQHALLLEDEQKNRFVVVQIAGFIARRIVSYIKKGDFIQRGARFGIIQFGSRVDLYLPKNATLRVKEGQTVRGGETVIGAIS